MPSDSLTLPAGASSETVGRVTPQPAAGVGGTGDPERLGRYVVIERIGSGGMGIVYAAYDPSLDRKVAVKLLLPGRAGTTGQARLLREAQAMAKLSHPNVVAVHDVGEHEERAYIAMDFVRGETLRSWLERAPRSEREVLAMFVQAGRGLAAAHEAGLVHRDFKPDNVLVDDRGRALVTDFGLARLSAVELESGLDSSSEGLRDGLTRPGAAMGTLAYMPPEQHRGIDADARADQFSFCASLWEALHGELPFPGADAFERAAAVLDGRMREPPRERAAPSWLLSALRRGLALDPADRWPTMDALLGALERGRGRARLRRNALVVAAIAIVPAALATWHQIDAARRVAACETEGAAIASVWNEQVRGPALEAIDATGVAFAGTTAQRLAPALDEYADGWQRARVEACTADSIDAKWDGETSARARWCLDERRMQLAALVDEILAVDAKSVERILPAAADLSRPESCLDTLVLTRLPAPPGDGLAELSEVRALLARATALGDAGRPEPALALARDATARADALGWPPLSAAARLRVGMLLDDLGSYEEAEQELIDAYFEATRAAAPATAVEAAIELAMVAGDRRARYEDAELWARHAAAQEENLGTGETIHTARRLDALADVRFATADYDDARALHERSIAIIERTLGSEHPALVRPLRELAEIDNELGAQADARARLSRGLAIAESAFGADHPLYGHALTSLGNADIADGELARAQAVFERVLAIAEASFGTDHLLAAAALNNLATVAHARGELDEARTLLERALAINERMLGPDHPSVAIGMSNLAAILAFSNHRAEARALHERALAIRERTLGPDHPDVAVSLFNLANLRQADGALAEARSLLERALAIWEHTLPSAHPRLGAVLTSLGWIAIKQGRPADATVLLERALALREGRTTGTADLADTRFALARALWESDRDRTRALELARAALGGYRSSRTAPPNAVGRVEAWLAERGH